MAHDQFNPVGGPWPSTCYSVARVRILCHSSNACSPNLVCEKLRSFKWRLREHRHEVTVENCWKSRLALQVVIFFEGGGSASFWSTLHDF